MFHRKLTLAAATAFLALTGCVNGPENATPDPTIVENYNAAEARHDFETNLTKWRQSGVVSYDYKLNIDCFCDPWGWMVVIVKKNEVDFVAPLDIPMDSSQFKDIPDIYGLFCKIENYLDNPEYRVKVTYDSKYGFPSEIHFNRIEPLPDGDMHYVASELNVTMVAR